MIKKLQLTFQNLLRKIRYEFRNRLAIYPKLYIPLARIIKARSGDSFMAVTKNTDFVIEAFPRSGNTFAVTAFRLVQVKRVIIAHHLHAPAQIMEAAERGIPSLVIIRKPEDAVVSLLLRRPEITPSQGFKAWILFYEKLLPYRSKFITSTFEQVTKDFGKVIQRVNEKYKTDFSLFNHSPELEKKCFASIEKGNKEKFGKGKVIEAWVARPSAVRNKMKEMVLKRIEISHIEAIIEKANKVYYEYTK